MLKKCEVLDLDVIKAGEQRIHLGAAFGVT